MPSGVRKPSGGFDRAARLQDFDGKDFEEEGETAVLPGPGRHDRLHAVVQAAASRQAGHQLRRELHRFEVPPAAFFCVIGKAAGLATFREGNARTNVCQADFNSPLIKPKANSIDSPGVVEAQKPGIVRGKCVHPHNLRCRRSQNDPPVPRNSLKNRFYGSRFELAIWTVSVVHLIGSLLGSELGGGS